MQAIQNAAIHNKVEVVHHLISKHKVDPRSKGTVYKQPCAATHA